MDQKEYRIICSEHSWVEGDAVRQLQHVSAFEGMVSVVGLPDIHPGHCSPVGAVFLTKERIYPALIGNDVGCGVGLFSTGIERNKIKKDKWVKKIEDMDQPFDSDLDPWRRRYGLTESSHDISLGTIGGGNHFAELQSIEKVFDTSVFESLRIDRNRLVILVHSGSRSAGDALFRDHTRDNGANGLDSNSISAQQYLSAHDGALKWAVCNRALIAFRFISSIGAECEPVLDMHHNSVCRCTHRNGAFWLHRKGATSSESGFVLIPGSRGSLSYLVRAKGDQEYNLWSLPHGAGRKWNRSSCKAKLRDNFPVKSLIQTALGSHVICEDSDLLYEEAPQAYKKIDTVINDLLAADLIDVIATFRPIVTYKTRKR